MRLRIVSGSISAAGARVNGSRAMRDRTRRIPDVKTSKLSD
jgi:hypothetical protein